MSRPPASGISAPATAPALIRRARTTLDRLGPGAVARLDEMIAGIERYHAARRSEPDDGS